MGLHLFKRLFDGLIFGELRLVFTGNRVGVGVVSASDPVKIENWSRKRSRNGSISSDSAYDSVAYDPVKTRLSDSQAEAGEATNHNSIGVISGIGRKWNRSDSAFICSVLIPFYSRNIDSDFRFSLGRKRFDSDYRTPTPTPSPVKTSLYWLII